jgi:ParB family chromosome partitioning protein
MAEFRMIPLADIIVPERLRAVEEDHALAIQASIVEHGQINPITVRRTPPATKPFKTFTLIAGAHRMRAMELLDLWEIEAVILDADRDEAQLLEISENLFRNELSALDRAVFVITYRDAWERKHGKIRRGGDQTLKLRESPLDQIPTRPRAASRPT